jgi:multisubunit Na+/H+ antiporter MnhF subunit
MNEWEIAAGVLVVGLLPCLAVCLWADASHGLVALQVGSVLLTTVLMVLSEGQQRQPFIDLAIISALMGIVGSLAFARMMERDL